MSRYGLVSLFPPATSSREDHPLGRSLLSCPGTIAGESHWAEQLNDEPCTLARKNVLSNKLTASSLALNWPLTSHNRPSGTRQCDLPSIHVNNENFVNCRGVHYRKIGSLNVSQLALFSLKPPNRCGRKRRGNQNVKNSKVSVHETKFVHAACPNNRLRPVRIAPATINTTNNGMPTATNCGHRSARIRSSSKGRSAIDRERTLISAFSCNR